MSNLRRLSLLLCVLLPVALAPGCSDNTSTKGQLISCTRGTHDCQPTESAVPAAGQCTDVDEDGDGEDHDVDDADDDAASATTPDDDDGDGTADDQDSDDDNDGIPDTDDCDEDAGGDDAD